MMVTLAAQGASFFQVYLVVLQCHSADRNQVLSRKSRMFRLRSFEALRSNNRS